MGVIVSKESIHEVIIIGSGPAGYTAAIYLKRGGYNPLVIQGLQPGGQLTQTHEVENFPGFQSILGSELMLRMEEHAKSLGVDMIFDFVKSVDFTQSFRILYGETSVYKAKAVIIATGSTAKYLGVKGEDDFLGFGVSACATCDGFFFKNKTVAVVGGGNTAVEDSIYLSAIAKKVYLIHRRNQLRGDKILQDKLFSLPNIEIIWDSEIREVLGEQNPIKALRSLIIENNKTLTKDQLLIDGLFIAIGHTPNTGFLEGYLDTDSADYLITNNTKVLRSGNIIEGIFAAGDVQDSIYRQAITSAGSGCIAAIQAQHFLRMHK